MPNELNVNATHLVLEEELIKKELTELDFTEKEVTELEKSYENFKKKFKLSGDIKNIKYDDNLTEQNKLLLKNIEKKYKENKEKIYITVLSIKKNIAELQNKAYQSLIAIFSNKETFEQVSLNNISEMECTKIILAIYVSYTGADDFVKNILLNTSTETQVAFKSDADKLKLDEPELDVSNKIKILKPVLSERWLGIKLGLSVSMPQSIPVETLNSLSQAIEKAKNEKIKRLEYLEHITCEYNNKEITLIIRPKFLTEKNCEILKRTYEEKVKNALVVKKQFFSTAFITAYKEIYKNKDKEKLQNNVKNIEKFFSKTVKNIGLSTDEGKKIYKLSTPTVEREKDNNDIIKMLDENDKTKYITINKIKKFIKKDGGGMHVKKVAENNNYIAIIPGENLKKKLGETSPNKENKDFSLQSPQSSQQQNTIIQSTVIPPPNQNLNAKNDTKSLIINTNENNENNKQLKDTGNFTNATAKTNANTSTGLPNNSIFNTDNKPETPTNANGKTTTSTNTNTAKDKKPICILQ